MSLSDELHRLGNSARRLNAGSDSLNDALDRIDALLGRLNVGLEYVHPRPLAETTTVDGAGKRIIELVYVGYLKVDRTYHLAVRTTKVLESRLQLATQSPGKVTALLHAPRTVRFAAVDVLPELVAGLAAQVDEMVAAMQRRQNTADTLLRDLETITSDASGQWHRTDVAAAMPTGVTAAPTPAIAEEAPRVTPDRTAYYPGMGQPAAQPGAAEAEVSPTTTRDEGGRKTVPLGSNTLRHVQQKQP